MYYNDALYMSKSKRKNGLAVVDDIHHFFPFMCYTHTHVMFFSSAFFSFVFSFFFFFSFLLPEPK